MKFLIHSKTCPESSNTSGPSEVAPPEPMREIAIKAYASLARMLYTLDTPDSDWLFNFAGSGYSLGDFADLELLEFMARKNAS